MNKSLILIISLFSLVLLLAACGDQGGGTAEGAPTVTFHEIGNSAADKGNPVFTRQYNVPVVVFAASGTAKVDFVELMIDGSLVKKDQVSPFELTINLPGTDTYQLSAVATDINGLKSEPVVQKVAVDTTAPTVDILSPQDGDAAIGTVQILISAVDPQSGISEIEVSAGGQPIEVNVNETTGEIVALWQIGDLPADAYEIKARAVNGAGLTAVTSIDLLVQGEGSEPLPPTASILEDEITPEPTSSGGCANPEGCYSGTLSIPVSVDVPEGGAVVTLYVSSKLGSAPVQKLNEFPYVFSLNTLSYSNNDELTLRVEAQRTEGSLTYLSDPVTITVYNEGATERPELSITSPEAEEVVSGLLPVSLSISKRGSDFEFASALTVELIGPGNNITATEVIPQSELVSNKTATYTTEPFDLIKPENDSYRLRAQVDVIVDPDGAARTETLQSLVQIRTRGQGEDPPASLIRMPVRPNGYDLGNPDSFPILNRSSGLFIEMSDDTGLAYVQVRLVCDIAIQQSDQNCDGEPLNGYFLNKTLNGVPGPVYETILELDIDSSVYAPNGNYMLEITTEDTAGNTNVEEIAVTVDRARSTIFASDGEPFTSNVVSVPNGAPEELNPRSATWCVQSSAASGITCIPSQSENPMRVVTLLKFNGEFTKYGVNPETRTAATSATFGEEGIYEVFFLVEDLTTGVVRQYGGQPVTVVKNPPDEGGGGNSDNLPPTANDDTATTTAGEPVVIAVLNNDTDPENDTLTVTEVSTPTNGTATVIADQVEYIPDAGFTGTDNFSYFIEDGNGGKSDAEITVTVN